MFLAIRNNMNQTVDNLTVLLDASEHHDSSASHTGSNAAGMAATNPQP